MNDTTEKNVVKLNNSQRTTAYSIFNIASVLALADRFCIHLIVQFYSVLTNFTRYHLRAGMLIEGRHSA